MYKIIKEKSINEKIVKECFDKETYKVFISLNGYNKCVLSSYIENIEKALKNGEDISQLKEAFIKELEYIKYFQ